MMPVKNAISDIPPQMMLCSGVGHAWMIPLITTGLTIIAIFITGWGWEQKDTETYIT
jgi:hypothetical protein